MKRILIIAKSFYPENSPRSFRATELVKEFARQGHSVTVLTPRINEVHNEFEKQYNCTIKDLGKLKWQAMEIKARGIIRLLRRGVRRFTKLLFEYPNIQLIPLVKKALQSEKGYDLLISIAMPHSIHWGVAWAWQGNCSIAKTWVADCGDPYMGQENDTFSAPFYFKYVEKWWSRKADFITVPTKGAIEGYYTEFENKLKIIPQGFRFEDIKMRENHSSKSTVEFAYAGMFIPCIRDPSEFLNYLLSLRKDFLFHIYTTTPQWVKTYAAKSDGRIILHKPIPRLDLLHKLSGLDFLINFENAGGKQSPSKLIDYAIIKKPILSIKTNDLKTIEVDQFIARDYTNSLKIDREQYRIEKVAQQFLSLLDIEEPSVNHLPSTQIMR